jgi:hypothetical protein
MGESLMMAGHYTYLDDEHSRRGGGLQGTVEVLSKGEVSWMMVCVERFCGLPDVGAGSIHSPQSVKMRMIPIGSGLWC